MSNPFTDWYDQRVDVDTINDDANEWGAHSNTTHHGVPCWVESQAAMVVTANGSEVRASSVLYAALADLGKFTPGSAVTLPDGRVATVVAVDSVDAAVDDDLDGITVRLV